MKLRCPGEKAGRDVGYCRSTDSALAASPATDTSVGDSGAENIDDTSAGSSVERGETIGGGADGDDAITGSSVEGGEVEADDDSSAMSVVSETTGVDTDGDVVGPTGESSVAGGSSTSVGEFLSCGFRSPIVLRFWMKFFISKLLSSLAIWSKL